MAYSAINNDRWLKKGQKDFDHQTASLVELEENGRDAWALKQSEWDSAKARYGTFTDWIEENFGREIWIK